MYKEYVDHITQDALLTNGDDDVVILELYWLGLYDFFMECVSRASNAELSQEAIEAGRAFDQDSESTRKRLRDRGFDIIEPPNSDNSRRMSLPPVYVTPLKVVYTFSYFWGYTRDEDNGHTSTCAPMNEKYQKAQLSWLTRGALESPPMVLNQKLRVYKNWNQAIRQLAPKKLAHRLGDPPVFNVNMSDEDALRAWGAIK